MNIIKYLRSSKWDMLLCAVMIFAISTTVFSGFYVPTGVASAYWITAIMAAIVTVLLMTASYDKRSIVIGIIAFVVICLVAVIIIGNLTGINIFKDKESNPYLRYVLQIIVSVAVFLLSRTRPGNAILFAVGIITICLVQFLYETDHIVCMMIFICSCGVMQMYRNYIYNILHSRTVKVAQGSAILVSTVVCILVIAVAGGIFYGLVKPLNPPKKDLKLITKYMSLEVLNKVGVATTATIKDPNKTTSNENDQTDTAKKKGEEKDKAPDGSKDNKAKQNNKNNNSPNKLDNSNNKFFKAIKYSFTVATGLILLGIIIAAIILAILIKLWTRRRWLKKVLEEDRNVQIYKMYMLYLKKFKQLGVKKSPEETPYEFSKRAEPHLWIFKEGKTGIEELTEIFVKTQYGAEVVTDEDQRGYLDFYRYFYRNCREYLGKFKYILKFFIL